MGVLTDRPRLKPESAAGWFALAWGLALNIVLVIFLFTVTFKNEAAPVIRLRYGLYLPSMNLPVIFQVAPNTVNWMLSPNFTTGSTDIKDMLWSNVDAQCYTYGSGASDLIAQSPTIFLQYVASQVGFSFIVAAGPSTSVVPVRLTLASTSVILLTMYVIILIWRRFVKNSAMVPQWTFFEYVNAFVVAGAMCSCSLVVLAGLGGVSIMSLIAVLGLCAINPFIMILCKSLQGQWCTTTKGDMDYTYSSAKIITVLQGINLTSKWAWGIFLIMKTYNFGYDLNSNIYSESIVANSLSMFQGFAVLFSVYFCFIEPFIYIFSSFVLHVSLKGVKAQINNMAIAVVHFLITSIIPETKPAELQEYNQFIVMSLGVVNVTVYFVLAFLAYSFSVINSDITCSLPALNVA